MHPCRRAPFSYRTDPAVPPFDETRTILVMDGECALCSAAARRIARWDNRDEIRIAPVGSPLGAALLTHYGLDPDDPASWLMVSGGEAYGALDAILRLAGRLHPVLGPLRVLGILPRPIQDWLYARIARNRYRLFGRDDLCALPGPALRRRLIA